MNPADAMPFSKLMGVQITAASADAVEGEITVRDDLCTAGGIMHGGAIMALADQAAGMAGLWCSVPGHVRYGVTVDLNCRFANRVPPGRVVAEAKVVSQGRSTYFVQFEIFDAHHKLVAFGSSTHRVRKGSESLEGVPGPVRE